MNQFVAIENINDVFVKKLFPSITIWNRLESRPRTDNFDRALKAEVRDALWMLSKQWQMGEFIGDDAGSPVYSKMFMDKTKITKYKPINGNTQEFDESIPLETKVERKKIGFGSETKKMSLDLRLLMGRQWLKLCRSFGATVKDAYIAKYSFSKPDPTLKSDALLTAHKESWQTLNAVHNRCMDGYALYEYLKSNSANHAYDGIATINPGQFTDINNLATKFIDWFEKLFNQPMNDEADAWLPNQLEYQFACSAPKNGAEKVMVADEYFHGHLDWYNLDIDTKNTNLGDISYIPPSDIEAPIKASFIPTPVTFDGMPDTRWWKFEDGHTNFGNINPKTTDLGKLLFIEFSLVYANDWFLLPITLPAGSIANVRGLTVSNVFGERIWVEAAGKNLDDNWNKWSMFTMNKKGKKFEWADNSLVVLPTVTKIQEGKPIEQISLIRDEMANMVWGVEKVIPLVTGKGKSGSEAATELHNRYQQILDQEIGAGIIIPKEIKYKATLSYNIMNTVPENWIPFIPVQADASKQAIKLQRAAMPRILAGNAVNAAEKIEPRTTLMREGLDINPAKTYFINEEEVPRSGTQVSNSFQRTRWYNGKIVTWLGTRKQTGKGEGSSYLEFDQALDVKKSE